MEAGKLLFVTAEQSCNRESSISHLLHTLFGNSGDLKILTMKAGKLRFATDEQSCCNRLEITISSLLQLGHLATVQI